MACAAQTPLDFSVSNYWQTKTSKRHHSKSPSSSQPSYIAEPPRKEEAVPVIDPKESCLEVLPTLKEVLPAGDLHPLSTSLVSLLPTEEVPECVEEIVFVLRDDTTPSLLIFANERSEVEAFADDLARELNNVLQSKVSYPFCIIPVYLRQQEASKAVHIIEETLSKVKPLVPYRRWMMMPKKKESIAKGLQTIQKP